MCQYAQEIDYTLELRVITSYVTRYYTLKIPTPNYPMKFYYANLHIKMQNYSQYRLHEMQEFFYLFLERKVTSHF